MTKEQIIAKYGKALASDKGSVKQAHGIMAVRLYAYAVGITYKRALKEIIAAYESGVVKC